MIEHAIENNLPEFLSLKNPNRYLVEGWVVGPSRAREIRVKIGSNTFITKDIERYRPEVRTSFFPADRSFQTLFPGYSIPVVISPVTATEEHVVQLECEFADGSTCKQDIGTITLSPSENVARIFDMPSHIDQDNLLVICMATYNPNGGAFKRQIDSIIHQDHRNWICLICDDNSSELARNSIKDAIKDDSRFFLIENSRNAGFYANFERCLELVPPHARFVALADQDDIWYPQKLSTCLQAFDAETMLVYCDMKIVDQDRKVLSPTYWRNRKNYYESKDLDLLTLANTVTGAASIFRRELLDLALPFPPRYGELYHDQWLAILAAGNGGIEYVDKPLYEYVQYGHNVIGHNDFKEQTFFSGVKKFVSQALLALRAHKGFLSKLLVLLKAFPAVFVSFYLFKHIHGRHVDALAETAMLRRVNAPARRLIQKTRTATGLLRINCKVWLNRETLGGFELQLLFSEIANNFYRWAKPLLAFYMGMAMRKHWLKSNAETGSTVGSN